MHNGLCIIYICILKTKTTLQSMPKILTKIYHHKSHTLFLNEHRVIYTGT